MASTGRKPRSSLADMVQQGFDSRTTPAGRPAAPAHVAGPGALHGVAAVVAERRVALFGPGQRLRRAGCRSRTRRPARRLAQPVVDQADRRRRHLLDARQRRLGPLLGGEDAELGPLLDREEVERQAAEDVVEEAGHQAQVRVVGQAGRLELHVGVLAHERGQRDLVLEPEADGDGEGVHDPGQGRALLGDLDEHLARTPVFVLAHGHVALAVGYPERERLGVALAGQAFAHGTDDQR